MKNGYVKLSIPEYDALMIGNYMKSRQLAKQELEIAELQEELNERTNSENEMREYIKALEKAKMTEAERKELIHFEHEIHMKAGKEYEKKLRDRMAAELEKAAFDSKEGRCVLLTKAKDIVLNQKLFDYDEKGRPILQEEKA